MASFAPACDAALGALPNSFKPWKAAVRIKDKDSHFVPYFNEMKQMESLGAQLALGYGKNSDAIGRKLLTDKVARSEQDVNTVMLTGFFHAYGPINNYFA